MKKNPLYIALLIYGIFSLATLYFWQSKEINAITGDEPHYLVISSGIVKQGSLEQTAPYREEFKAREIYKNGLAPEDAIPSPDNTHAILGGNGLFSVHNIGLPFVLAVPFFLGGVVGAKILMVFLGSLVIVCAWKFSSLFSENENHRLWAVIAATISLPLIPASNQIYPDVLAGLISITGLYWFFTVRKPRSTGLESLLTLTLVFLPWLQIKFAATCVVLVLSIALKIYFQSRDLKRVIRIFIIAGASCLALVAYNYYAFGKFSGPYQSGALEISKTSMMVLLGLHIDQNQGFILQNPVNLIGILAIGWIYKINRTFSLVWALVFLSLIVPNALHPTWYGGWSLSGRFQWAAAITFIIPSICGLLVIANNKKNIFKLIISSAIILQFYFFYIYAIDGARIYNKGLGTWFDDYAIFYYSIHEWLPMLYDSSWAYEYFPNYSWLFMCGNLLLFGFCGKNLLINAKILLIISLVFIFSAGFQNNQAKNQVVFKASQLPSQTGTLIGLYRSARPNIDKQGFINFGPYLSMREGDYEVLFSYRSDAGYKNSIGWIDVYDANAANQLIKTKLNGTNNNVDVLKVKFKLTEWKSNSIEFRMYWDGASNLELRDVTLNRVVFN